MDSNVINRAKDELNRKPLVAIDIILEAFSEIKCTGVSENITEFLTILSQAILIKNEVNEESWIDNPVDGLFNRELSQHVRRFIAICLLRLLATNNECFSRQTEFGIKAFNLFDDVLAEDIYPSFGIDKKEQTFKKQSRLEDVVPSVEDELSTVISSLNSLKMFSTARFHESFMQAIRNKKSKAILNPFLPKDLLGVRLDEIFGTVENYLEEKESGKLRAFEKAKDTLQVYLSEAEHYGTRYSCEYLGGITKKLLELLREHFDDSPISKPAKITVTQGDKKYPLSTAGRSFNLSFTITNDGPGYAFDVSFSIETDDLIPEQPEFYRGKLEPSFQIVEVPVQVKHPADSVYAIITIKWTNFDRTSNEAQYDFYLKGQPYGIDWDHLEKETPYDLEPVTTEDELVGRSEILSQLFSQTQAKSITSSYIFGQKRVGKTSIVKTLKTIITRTNSDRYLVVYLEGGDYIHPQTNRTIERLGEKLCKKIQNANSQFHNIEIPVFDGALSPLSDFLDSVEQVAPDYKILFILDEFDELPGELYRSEEIGRPFFLTLRSISHRPNFGFILVGGEKMKFIMSNQAGIILNKFDKARVDYFDREKHWSDFRDLVLKPLPSGIEFSDTAIVSLYEQTAGNPFFTKLICRTLFKTLVERRDSHVTCKEVEKATKLAAREEGSERFQHFWLDGIVDRGTRAEVTKAARRRVLVALAEVLRLQPKAEKGEIISHAKQLGLSEAEIEAVLKDFIRRQILLTSKDTQPLLSKEEIYECKVPFFGEWLKETGVQEIINTSEDLDVLLEDKKLQEETRISAEEIVHWVQSRGISYQAQPINEDKVRVWLNQFKKSDDFDQFEDSEQQKLMFHMLQHLKFYSQHDIRAKLREAHGMVVRDLRESGLFWTKGEKKLKRSDILISYLDDPGKSGAHYAKLYADENNIYYSERGNVIELGKLGKALKEKQNLQALVFVDDFIGTGASAAEYFKGLDEEYGEALRNSGLQIFFIALCGFVKGKSKIENMLDQLHLPANIHIRFVLVADKEGEL